MEVNTFEGYTLHPQGGLTLNKGKLWCITAFRNEGATPGPVCTRLFFFLNQPSAKHVAHCAQAAA
jgi:hypothetical protein